MIFFRFVLTLCATFLCFFSAGTAEEVDVVAFRSGGQLNGAIAQQVESRRQIVLRTESGSILKLKGSRLLRSVSSAATEEDLEAFNNLSKQAVDSAGHWKMYEWCRDKSRRSKFKKQAIYHLRQIVKIDPTDDKAWRSFGLVDPNRKFINVDGAWIPEQNYFRSAGYVKVNSNWVPEIQREAKEQQLENDNLRNSKKAALKRWQRNVLSKGNPDRIRSELFKLMDAQAVSLIEIYYLNKERDPFVRALYIEAIGQVATREAQVILVKYLMTDPEPEVREQAMLLLEQFEQYDIAGSASMIAQFLKAKDVKIVRRAGRILGRLNSDIAIRPLIAGLETQHEVATGNERTSVGFDSQGGTGMTMGGPKTKIVKFKHDDILEALEDITGQQHGFDKELWREWFIQTHASIETSGPYRRFDD